jgi:hypothetical protein
MATTPQNGRNRGGKRNNPAEKALGRAERSADSADQLLTGGIEPELQGARDLDSVVRTIARQVGAANTRLTGGNTLETMSRLKQDTLLSTPLVQQNASNQIKITDGGATLKDALDEVESSMINELFATEKGRLDDYQTYAQIADLITQAGESIQAFTDNIVSPDDFTKRDVAVFYDGTDEEGKLIKQVKAKADDLIKKYMLEDRAEEAITKALVKGDYFMVILNLRQELEGILNEQGALVENAQALLDEHRVSQKFEAQHVPNLEDPDVKGLMEIMKLEIKASEAKGAKDGALTESTLVAESSKFREELAAYFNELLVVNEDASGLVGKQAMSMKFAQDLPSKQRVRAGGKMVAPGEGRGASLAGSKVTGSVVKMVPPENVVKLYQDDTLFGYYFIELSGPDIADFARRGTMDQTAMVRAIDQNLSVRALGGNTGAVPKGKDALISRIIIKTLSTKLGNSKYLKDHEEFASDAYAILSRARRERRRATFTYVAPDQMVHFTPNGSTAYGESVLSRIKFLSKLYLGAMTNAFMRNSIRRPERLVWYIDIGTDNDGSNSVQNFIRTIKQREVKFSNLRDITTTINQIGEFHDFYVPTYNGERPVDVETLNMGAAAEVDNAYLEYLRKAIIGGTGVPAAYLGYSEEVAFARSLTMDNGRFLRRVIRNQKHFGAAMTRVLQILWRNEYMSLEELVGKTKDQSADDVERASKERSDKENAKAGVDRALADIDISKIVVRYPSPATLNMTNLADAMNQGQPVAEFITDVVGSGEEDDVKNELKKQVLQDLMPQIHWSKYHDMLDNARKAIEKKKAGESTTPAAGGGDGLEGGGDGLGAAGMDAGGDGGDTAEADFPPP